MLALSHACVLARQRKNYCIEGLHLLGQFHFYLNERQSHQLIWSRHINIHGLPGRNVPCDLFLEHLNKICKQAIVTLGSNFSEKALVLDTVWEFWMVSMTNFVEISVSTNYLEDIRWLIRKR
uniref:DUF6589 domain-containing protein n=1 Tax=Amphimedon queenslandica TaxID=400682 RepID=A0A1X7V2L4_AMPQE